jgi:hypothetical protein
MGLLQPVPELENEEHYFIYNFLTTLLVTLTNCMELSHSLQAVSCSATREIFNILWNPMVDYYVQNSVSLVLILGQINPVHTTLFYYSYIHFNIIISHSSRSSSGPLFYYF